MLILGINAFHGDSSACLIKDGELIAAVEEERFRRVKHWAGFPSLSIKYCLEAAGIGITEVDFLAVNRRPGPICTARPGLRCPSGPAGKLFGSGCRQPKSRATWRNWWRKSFILAASRLVHTWWNITGPIWPQASWFRLLSRLLYYPWTALGISSAPWEAWAMETGFSPRCRYFSPIPWGFITPPSPSFRAYSQRRAQSVEGHHQSIECRHGRRHFSTR